MLVLYATEGPFLLDSMELVAFLIGMRDCLIGLCIMDLTCESPDLLSLFTGELSSALFKEHFWPNRSCSLDFRAGLLEVSSLWPM